MRRFNMRLSESPRDATIAEALVQMTRRGKNASEWVKDTLYAAITGTRIAPLLELDQEAPAPKPPEDPEAAQALRALGNRFR